MELPTREAFVQRVGRFDQRELTRFVADLYEARDWQVDTVDSARLTVRAPRRTSGETLEVHVTETLPTDRVDADRIVVGTTTDVEWTADGTRVVDVRELHGMVLYAIDRDRLSTLLADHFEPGAFAGSRSPLHRFAPAIPAPPSVPALPSVPLSAANVILVVVILFASVAFVAADGFDRPLTPGGDAEPTVTPVSVSHPLADASTATETPTRSSAVCPRAPTDAHPASLRPVPVDAALGVGLEGWEDVRQINASAFQGPNELTIPWTPEIRHESTYRSPRGTTITLVIDRWADRQSAAKAGTALASNYRTALVWGRYTFAVIFPDSTADSPIDSTNADVDTDALLSEIMAPGNSKLGSSCVDSLVESTG